MNKPFTAIEESGHYFSLDALEQFLRSKNIRVEHSELLDYLKKAGFESTTKEFLTGPVRVWIRKP